MTYGVVYISLLILFVFCGLIYPFRSLKAFLLSFDAIISIPSFFVKSPAFISWDIDHYKTILDSIRAMNIFGVSSGLDWSLHSATSPYSNQPGVAIYLWIFSLFKENGVFFYATTLFFLVALSLFICKVVKELKVSKKEAVLIQLIILMTFNIFYEIQGVRNFLAFMLFAVALYYDFTLKSKYKKIICWFFYLVAYSLHPSVIPLIFIRILVGAFHKKLDFYILGFLLLIYNLFLPILTNILSKISIFSVVSIKMEQYLYGQSDFEAHAGGNEIMFTSLILIALVLELFLYLQVSKRSLLPRKYSIFYYMTMLFTIGSFLSTQVYLRNIMLLLFLSIPMKIYLFSDLCKEDIYATETRILSLYKVMSFALATLMLMYWSYTTYFKVLV
ncbi:EpsG family protein [Lactobacillus crispatus]|uniref:EpsG family protein n=2 Tax=Bacteria TaxID=2 RepID=A0A2N5KZ96_9LACO|nr:EpsG family protein [Lactobacillus crispatus]KAA8788491.1 hypothetical protein F1B94_08460 [Lactobacillus crispatus]KAA8788508.1 hypothetical protein F1B98_08455 [Lactobacillus crispatus]MBI1704423.1 EpsG family [Lactobacillus crispatus]PLT11552.1 hypothetical protein CYJ79_04250 [Lactobacillus crispatus]